MLFIIPGEWTEWIKNWGLPTYQIQVLWFLGFWSVFMSEKSGLPNLRSSNSVEKLRNRIKRAKTQLECFLGFCTYFILFLKFSTAVYLCNRDSKAHFVKFRDGHGTKCQNPRTAQFDAEPFFVSIGFLPFLLCMYTNMYLFLCILLCECKLRYS